VENMNDTQKIKNEIEDYYIRYGPMVLRRCRVFFPNEDEALDNKLWPGIFIGLEFPIIKAKK
jgi:hypothetical protein